MQMRNTGLRLDEEIYNEICDIAIKKRKKPSAFIRQIVEDYVRNYNYYTK